MENITEAHNAKKKVNIAGTITKVVRIVDNGHYNCNVVQGCAYTQPKFLAGNFKRHIQRVHPAEFGYLNLGDIQLNTTPKKNKKLSPFGCQCNDWWESL